MIEFKDPNIKIRCTECKEENHIYMKYLGTEKEQRTIGFEYEHTYRGESECSNCDEKMRLLITLYEFPKGIFNYIDINKKSCLLMDDITEDKFNIINE